MVFMKKYFYLFLLSLTFFLLSFDGFADSIAGGKMEFTYTGTGDRYKITVTLFVDETFKFGAFTAGLGPSQYGATTMPWIAIYSKTASISTDVQQLTSRLSFVRSESVAYQNIECVNSRTLATKRIIMETTVSIPAASFNNVGGYYIVYEDGNRNLSNNIGNSIFTGIRLYTEFPSQSAGTNDSPIFKPVVDKVACVGQLYSLDVGATDTDPLTYSLATPMSGQGNLSAANKNAYIPVVRTNLATAYVLATYTPVAGATISSAGVLSFTPTTVGTFVFTIECKEYKGGNPVGLVRQDIEVRVEDCVIITRPKIHLEEGDPAIHLITKPICDGSFRVLETISKPLTTYKWYKNGVFTGQTGYKIKIQFADIGIYEVELTTTGNCPSGPTKSLPTDITPNGVATVRLNVPTTNYCEGLTAINFTISGNPSGSKNNWFKNGVDITANVGTFPYLSYNISSPTVANSGLYKIQVTDIVSLDKCTYEDSVKITVTPAPIAVITNVTGITVVCLGANIILQATASPGVTYQWTRDLVNDSNAPLKNVSQTGSYALTVTSTVNPLCTATASPVVITVNPNPLVTFAPIPPLCNQKGTKVDLRNLVMPQTPLGVFTGKGVNGYEFDPTVSGYGSFPITYTYTTSAGCLGNNPTQTAIVDLTPVIKLGNDFTIFRGDVAQIKSIGSIGSQYTYEWTPIAGILPSITDPQPFVNPVLTTQYEVKVTSNLGGCFAKAKINVTVRPRLKFAEGFTPNNDAINDTWEIEGMNEYPNAEVIIYNRWGGEIFYSIGYNQAFDGIQNRERLPAGTYFYVIKPSSDVPVLTGYVTIVR